MDEALWRRGFDLEGIVIRPDENRIVRDGAAFGVEPKVMDVLVCLVTRGPLVSREDLIATVWGDVVVTDHVLSRCISELRKALGDDHRTPRFVETIRKRGYRLIPTAIAASHGATEAAAGEPARRWRHWSVIAACVGLIAWAIAELATDVPRPPTDRELVRELPITSYAGSELDPVLSPDGHRVAFAWSGADGANFDIYSKELDAPAPTRMTTHPGEDKNPAWSPDGRRIAFVRAWIAGSGLWVVNADARGERELHRTVSGDIPDLLWRPDGTALLFVDRPAPDRPYAVFELDLATLERRQLTAPPEHFYGDRDLAVASDGRLAFARAELVGVEDLFVARSGGGEARRLTRDRKSITGIEWTKAGDELVFSSDRVDATRLWRVAASGGRPRPILGFGVNASDPHLHDDGRVVYERRRYAIDIWITQRDDGGGWAKPKPLLASTRIDSAPSFSPDGETIAFVSGRAGRGEIWLANRRGGDLRRLTWVGDLYPELIDWSPDGRHIAFVRRDEDRQADLFVVTVASGHVRRLTDNAALEVAPRFSHDGRSVYFGCDASGNWQIWRIPASSGAAEQITQEGGLSAAEDDRRVLYFVRPHVTGLWRRVVGGPAIQVADLPGIDRRMDFTVSAGGIYFRVGAAGASTSRIRFLSFSGEERELSGLVLEDRIIPALGFAVSPDERALVYTHVEVGDSDVLMVEGFR